MQIHDLTKSYQTKTDEELVQLASNSDQLTPEARSILAGELARRRIDVTETPDHKEQPSHEIKIDGSYAAYPRGVREFVEEVLSVYRGEFWFFIKLVVPAVVVGYLAVLITRNEARDIARHIPRGLPVISHQTEFLEMLFLSGAGYLVSWMAFSFSFGAICSAVSQIRVGVVPSIGDCFAAVHERLGSFMRLSLLLLFVLFVALAGAGLVSLGILWVVHLGRAHPSYVAIQVLSYTTSALAILLMSRFGLAIPALILDKYKVGQSMFRSDELTEGKWLLLAVLLMKSLIGGYIVAVLPFWLASFIPATTHLASWFPWSLTIASIAGVTAVEPTMFIGFALLYVNNAMAAPTSIQQLSHQLT